MKKIRIGVISPSEIAYRRFMPALMQSDSFEYAGIAVASKSDWFGEATDTQIEAEYAKAGKFKSDFGGTVFNSYSELIEGDYTDAIYLPLPPALHYEWGKKVLTNDKHLFVEKPSTTRHEHTRELINIAQSRNLAIHENYMFSFHSQLETIQKMIHDNKIGDLRLYRIAFGFPKRAKNDFRYNKVLGGGALLDCGGYTIKLANMLLGDTAKIVTSNLNYTDDFEVDMYGSATMVNDDGITAQLSFGMDNNYKCELEVWGSEGVIRTNRIFSAPSGYEPELEVKIGNAPWETVVLEADDTFKKSIEVFRECIDCPDLRTANFKNIERQAQLVSSFSAKG